MLVNGNSGSIISGNNNNVTIQNVDYLQQRIHFLEREIGLKDKEIEARDRDIEIFKSMIEEIQIIKKETEKSRAMIVDLYERKIADLKQMNAILQKQLEYKI